MVKIEMEMQDSQNLKAFLERVNMKGVQEAMAMVRISNAVNHAEPIEPLKKKVGKKENEKAVE